MPARGLGQLVLSALKVAILAVLFIDVTHIRLTKQQQSGPAMITMPSQEETAAKQKVWEDRLLGRFLVDERDQPRAPAAAPPEQQQQQQQSADVPAEQQPWLHVADDGKHMVRASLIPGRVRAIWPGTPVTRDLCPTRLNVCCDNTGKITSVGFY
ncbi:hypothetical protein H4R18_005338 [Coemansia javaensis]|uniref:Uncharacterized protein n=1 Tax=Coemansia javaensis TaxID=2761396 RepID=A0A9W8LEZ0_9FUNG|nr:hypothetical protein H4R18_005338 [Coemansia javaensis]